MKKFVLFTAVFVVVSLVSGLSWAQTISTLSPARASPGQTITVEGRNLNDCPEDSRVLSIYFPSRGVYLDWRPDSWTRNRIIAIIPEIDTTEWPQYQKTYFLNNIVEGELKIDYADEGGRRANCARGVSFRYVPPAPNILVLFATDGRRGSEFDIVGKGFGDLRGKIVYPKAGGEGEVIIEEWTNDAIKARIPMDMPLGTNSIWVKRLNSDDTYTNSNVYEMGVLPVEVRTVPSKLMTSPRYSPYPKPRIPPPR